MPRLPTYIFLSPHLDDAALSCGGMIHHLARALPLEQPAPEAARRGGAGGSVRVVVVTICAGDPPPGPLSPFAQSLHERWAGAAAGPEAARPAGMPAGRRAEDLRALARLGAEVVHFDIPDCIYRLDPAGGGHPYPDLESVFGALHPADSGLVRAVAARVSALREGLGGGEVIAPLGLGGHVDHQLARRAAEAAGGVYACYEDYPYASGEAGLPGSLVAEGLTRGLRPGLFPLDAADLQAKIEAISAYHSQISSFWESLEVMAASVRRFAAQTGGGMAAERLWHT